MTVTVKIDASQLIAWASKAASKLPSALASAVNKSAREGRTVATNQIAADENVSTAVAKRGIGPLNRASPGKLIATWQAKTTAIGVLNTQGGSGKVAYTTAKARRTARGGATLNFSTFSVTGGGSAHLALKRAFVITANGGRALMIRLGPGKKDIKSVYAASAASIMKQEKSAPRIAWQKTVETSLPKTLTIAVQAVLDGGTGPSDSGSGD